jgi:hypothetical protein
LNHVGWILLGDEPEYQRGIRNFPINARPKCFKIEQCYGRQNPANRLPITTNHYQKSLWKCFVIHQRAVCVPQHEPSQAVIVVGCFPRDAPPKRNHCLPRHTAPCVSARRKISLTPDPNGTLSTVHTSRPLSSAVHVTDVG